MYGYVDKNKSQLEALLTHPSNIPPTQTPDFTTTAKSYPPNNNDNPANLKVSRSLL